MLFALPKAKHFTTVIIVKQMLYLKYVIPSSDSGREDCSIFYLSRSDGGSCPNKKNGGRRDAISIYIPVANAITPERASLVTKLPFRSAKFLSNRDRVLARNLPLSIQAWMLEWPQLLSAKIISEESWKNSVANSRVHSIHDNW